MIGGAKELVKNTVVFSLDQTDGKSKKHFNFREIWMNDIYQFFSSREPGHLVNHKWENAMTVDEKSWGIRRNMNLQDM